MPLGLGSEPVVHPQTSGAGRWIAALIGVAGIIGVGVYFLRTLS
jgi:hypothetical protein